MIYWGTGNPHPVLAGAGRAGANLYTCSILALNADTGKIAWYFQASPHDTHDWDAVETPVLIDAPFNGKPRKLLAQASRNGYFFVLDRVTGKNLLTVPFSAANWAKGVDANGSPIPNPAKEPQLDGTLIRLAEDGGTSWMSPSFDPQTGLFYFNAWRGDSMWYLSPGARPTDHQGGGTDPLVATSVLLALDYQTGKIRWQRESGEGSCWRKRLDHGRTSAFHRGCFWKSVGARPCKRSRAMAYAARRFGRLRRTHDLSTRWNPICRHRCRRRIVCVDSDGQLVIRNLPTRCVCHGEHEPLRAARMRLRPEAYPGNIFEEIRMRALVIAAIASLCCSLAPAQTVSPLFARGYTVIPDPQKVSLGASNFSFNSSWQLSLAEG